MEDIKLDVPLCDQFNVAHDTAWVHRMCAICSLWMLLKYNDSMFNMPAMDLLKEALAQNGYLENIGWRHWGIVKVAEENGLVLRYAERFFYTPEEKEIGAVIIAVNLKNRHPVMASVFHHLNPAKGGHMIVIHGFQEFNGQPIGYYIQDPDASFRGHNYFLTKEEFFAGWRGGLIYRDEPST